MFDHDPNEAFELIGIVARVVAATLIANSLLFLLALRLFPRFANWIRRGASHLLIEMANSRRKNSRFASSILRVAKWLDVEHRPAPHQFTDPVTQVRMINRIAKNRAYETWMAETPTETLAKLRSGKRIPTYRNWIVKVPQSRNGYRVLQKERHVVDLLVRAAADTTYASSFPTEVPVETYEFGPGCGSVWLGDTRKTNMAYIRRGGVLDEVEATRFICRLFGLLGFVHRQGTVHGAIFPQHLIVDPNLDSLMLVDWTHARQIGKRFRHVPSAWRNWLPPEAKSKGRATPATDIYMAMKTFLMLVGGNPETSIIPNLSRPLRGIVKACLLDSPRMRPGDAWELQDELEEILESHCGSRTTARNFN